jgi:hypothetical protein
MRRSAHPAAAAAGDPRPARTGRRSRTNHGIMRMGEVGRMLHDHLHRSSNVFLNGRELLEYGAILLD